MPTSNQVEDAMAIYFATAISITLLQGIIFAQVATYYCSTRNPHRQHSNGGSRRSSLPHLKRQQQSIAAFGHNSDDQDNRDAEGWARDRWWGLRGYTTLIMACCIFETVCQIVKSWTFVRNSADWPRHMMRTSEILTNVIVTSLVQIFFIKRCWKAARNVYVLAYLVILLLGQAAINICMSVALRGGWGKIVYGAEQDVPRPNSFVVWEPTALIPFFVIVPIILDVSITIVLIVNFKRWKTGLPAADALLRHVCYLAFEAAALPTVARLAAGIGWFAHYHPLAVVCGMLPAKLYVISYLRALNVRWYLRQRAHSVHGREALGASDGLGPTIEFTMPWQTDSHPWASPVDLSTDSHAPSNSVTPKVRPGNVTFAIPSAISPVHASLSSRPRMPRSDTMDSERELTFIEALCVTQPGNHHGHPATSAMVESQISLAAVPSLPSIHDQDLENTTESRRSSEATCVPADGSCAASIKAES